MPRKKKIAPEAENEQSEIQNTKDVQNVTAENQTLPPDPTTKEETIPNLEDLAKATKVIAATSNSQTVPPKVLKRNEFGLIEGQEYKYKENGFIDWRAMVDKKYLYPNKDRAKGETDIDKLNDNQLVISLGGLKELARIRGYKSVKFPHVNTPSSNYVCSVCEIEWIPNYETEGRPIVTSAMSSAHRDNTNSFMADYYAECAENRSFCRNVRSALGIDIVSHEELFDKNDKKQDQGAPAKIENDMVYETVKAKMQKVGLTMEQLKEKCINSKKSYTNPENWQKVTDINKEDVFNILSSLRSIEKKHAQKQSS